MAARNPRFLEEMPEVARSDQSTAAIATGAWKYVQPRYQDILAPCARRCPAGNDIPGIMNLASAGRMAEAAALLRAGNPFPATLGRVCPHPCGLDCNREEHGGRISVPMVERFLGDLDIPESRPEISRVRSGRRIAVIGAGPAGITAAWFLAIAGHDVEVFDDQPQPGGYLRTGIPDYRLPKAVLDREIEWVGRAGVRFVGNTRVGLDTHFADLRANYHAVIAAVGSHRPRRLQIAGLRGHANLLEGIALLADIQAGRPVKIPSPVAVIGGGNTAIDVARSLLRLGKGSTVVYRRTQAEMPAIAEEVRAAMEEGVRFCFLASPSLVVTRNQEIVALECLRMQLGEADASGRRAPAPIPGSEFQIPVRGVVTAAGETSDLDFMPQEMRAMFAGERDPEKGQEGFFLAGDAATGAGTVAAAVGSGRRVAAMVDAYLQHRRLGLARPGSDRFYRRPVDLTRVAGPDCLNPAYLIPEAQPCADELPVAARIGSFQEVIRGFGAAEVVREARRCLSCGTCNGCMNCYNFCPDVAIRKRESGARLEVDLAHCKGCGICAEECPRGAIVLEGVES